MPSTPIIFRTKNTAKSRLGLIGKNFGKNLWENVSWERKAPNLEERGQGVLKYERIEFVGKDSGNKYSYNFFYFLQVNLKL